MDALRHSTHHRLARQTLCAHSTRQRLAPGLVWPWRRPENACQRSPPPSHRSSPPPPPQGDYRIDAAGSPTMLKSLMYKLSYYE
jgi:hypothetical protein